MNESIYLVQLKVSVEVSTNHPGYVGGLFHFFAPLHLHCLGLLELLGFLHTTIYIIILCKVCKYQSDILHMHTYHWLTRDSALPFSLSFTHMHKKFYMPKLYMILHHP